MKVEIESAPGHPLTLDVQGVSVKRITPGCIACHEATERINDWSRGCRKCGRRWVLHWPTPGRWELVAQ